MARILGGIALDMADFYPVVYELLPAPNPAEVFSRARSLPHVLFLDSATARTASEASEASEASAGNDVRLGRHSFLAFDPFAFFTSENGTDAWAAARAAMREWHTLSVPELPPFQGGVAGMLGFEAGRRFETLPSARADEFKMPTVALGLYDLVIAWDHHQGRAWIISQGLPQTEYRARREHALARLEQTRAWLFQNRIGSFPERASLPGVSGPSANPVSPAGLVRQFPVLRHGNLTSTFSKSGYLAAVNRAIRWIEAGDIFQVNLSQRLLHPAREDSATLYLRLRENNPAPFAGYFDMGNFQICSASPERFLQVANGLVETRPIKGTRRRNAEPNADRAARAELLQSEKDRAENVMIVDLLRNDLGRVCEVGTVQVEEVCRLETYATVHHLVSSVRGRLREGADVWDLLAASFPGGSITGAPKIRAMEIIAELEPTARGAYCGALGYIGFDEAADWNILIRTITAGRGWWQAPVGGGIVADSDPEAEYAETWHKAEGLVQAMCETSPAGGTRFRERVRV